MPANKMQGEFSAIYKVVEVAPQSPPSVTGLQASAERRFKLPCQYVQDFGLRALGKLYETGTYDFPELPVEYPHSNNPMGQQNPNGWADSYPQRLKLRAVGFRQEPTSDYCFNRDILDRGAIVPAILTKLNEVIEMAHYWKVSETTDPESGLPVAVEDNCCECVVSIQYQEQWWHCLWSDAIKTGNSEYQEWLDETAFKVDRVASYELYTRPNRALVWGDKLDAGELDEPDAILGPDTHAVTVIPSAEVTVEWHNIPVSKLCVMETHLSKFRNKVNCTLMPFFNQCNCAQTSFKLGDPPEDCSAAATDCQYEAETMLFVDFAEDKSRRTTCFGPMDTTTLILTFKHKRIAKGSDVYGHNHLLYDKSLGGADESEWQRVRTMSAGVTIGDLFEKVEMNKMFTMEILTPEDCAPEEPPAP